MGCGDVNVGLCHEEKERERKGEEKERSPSKFSVLSVLGYLIKMFVHDSQK